MSQKIAKALRRAAGYRNASKTPTAKPFPGLANRGYEAPVYDGAGRPVMDVKTGKPETTLIPVTAPILCAADSKRAQYRKLKRLIRDPRFRADVVEAADGVLDDLAKTS